MFWCMIGFHRACSCLGRLRENDIRKKGGVSLNSKTWEPIAVLVGPGGMV